MPSDGAQLLAAYRQLDALLVGKGAPATSPAWLDALTDFWLSDTFRMVVRKGRQVGASTTISPRVCVATCLFGDFSQARGTRGTFGFSSTRQKEADERLFNIERTFFDVGVRVKVRGDTIEIPNRPVVVQSYPATADVARGANAWAWWEDEMPAWRDGQGANPASERDGAIVPACVMHENARIYSIGTPLGQVDHHAALVALGNTESQRVYVGPSWHWNPTLTEARTRAIQPIERLWLREFAAIPQQSEVCVFRVADIDRAMEERGSDVRLSAEHERVMAIDASRGGDAWTYCIARWTAEDVEIDETNCGLAPSGRPWCLAVPSRTLPTFDRFGRLSGHVVERQDTAGDWHPFAAPPGTAPRPTLEVEELGEVPDGADTEGAVAFLAGRACERRPPSYAPDIIRRVFADQYEFGALSVLLKRAGMRPYEERWSPSTKERAVDRLERLLRDGAIRLPNHPTLRRQLSEYSEKITRSGSISYGGRGRHDDYAQVLVTLSMASVACQLPGDPFGIDRRRHELGP